MQVRKPVRATRSLLLAAMVMLPALAVMPLSHGQGLATCSSKVQNLASTPVYVAAGGRVNFTFDVVDVNTAPDDQQPLGAPFVKVRITLQQGGTNVVAPETIDVNVPSVGVRRSFTAPATPGSVLINITLLDAATAYPAPNPVPPNYCAPSATEAGAATQKGGVWVDLRPDLEVVEVTFLQHFETTTPQGTAVPETHDADFPQELRYTRYPTVNAAPPDSTVVCSEETPQAPSRLHFRVKVKNAGDAGFNARPAEGDVRFPLPLRVRIMDGATQLSGGALEVQNVSIEPDKDAVVSLVGFSYHLVGKAGNRSLQVILDPDNEYPEEDDTDNAFPASPATDPKLRVDAPDLVAEFSGDITATTGGGVSGAFKFRNAGTQRAGTAPVTPVEGDEATDTANICHSRNGGNVVTKVYVDVKDTAHEVASASESLNPGQETGSRAFSTPKLKAGNHSLILVADAAPGGGLADNALEVNETNNEVVVSCPAVAALCVPDTKTPVLSGVKVTPASGRANQNINLSGNVSDDADFSATQFNKVFLDVTYPNGTQLSLFTLAAPVSGDDYLFWLNVSFPLEGTYTFRARAVDSSGKTSVFPALTDNPLSFTLSSFTKAVQNVKVWLCKGTSIPAQSEDQQATNNPPTDCTVGNNTNHYAWSPTVTTAAGTIEGLVLNATFQVPPDATGLGNESRNASRKWVQVTDPDNRTLGFFTVEPVCFTQSPATGDLETTCPTTPAPDEPCTGSSVACYNYTFRMRAGVEWPLKRAAVPAGATSPGCDTPTLNSTLHFRRPAEYNLTLWVYDAGCGSKANGLPNTPLYTFQLWATPSTNVTEIERPSGRVNAGTNATIRANVTSAINAEPAVKKAQVNVYWPGNGTLLGSFAMSPVQNFNATSGNGTYRATLDTGFGRSLDVAGNYEAVIAVQDANRTWSYAAANGDVCTPSHEDCDEPRFIVQVADTRTPSITNAQTRPPGGTSSTTFQEGTPVVVQANVEDDTRLRVEAVFQNATTFAEVKRVNMSRTGTLYHTSDLPTGNGTDLVQGSYRVLVVATDSAAPTPNVVQSSPIVISIAGNLPPAFLRLTPEPNGHGRPGGVVSVDVVDAREGVASSTIVVKVGPVNGTLDTVTTVIKNETDRVEGKSTFRTVRASFVLPTGFTHGARVAVNVTASDGTDPTPLTSSEQWEFTVDALAPRSTLACSRAHPRPCGETGAQAVRGDTVFFLNATDPDPDGKARAGIARLELTVEAHGAVALSRSFEVPNATFTLGQAVREDGVVKVRFRAVDAAGNSEPERSLDFVLDQQGPQAQNVLVAPTPAGWNVSATISDLASDVRNARVLHRTDVTGYQAVEMRQLPDTRFWYGDIPGSRRGTRVCYYIEATDFLGNVATNGTAEAPACFQGENHPPALTLLSPQEGEDVGASMTVRWQVSDIDGDPVTVSISYRRQGESQLIAVPLTSEDQGRRTRIVDTSQLVEGTYLLRVDAADTQAFNNRTTRTLNFTVGGGGASGRPQFDRDSIGPGEPVTVRVEIARPVSDIQARLLRGGAVVDTQPMEQEPPGSRSYEATFRIAEPGVYEVEVVGEYEDGTPFTIRSTGSVTVQAGLPALLDVAVMVVLTAAVVALAVVGLRRRGLM